MMTPYSTNTMLDVLAGKSVEAPSTNEDVVAHEQEIHAVSNDPLVLRLLPGFLRRPLSAWMRARRYDRSLVRLWETSPHLLNDMGVVLTDKGTLPEHLVAAPARVIEHVAAIAPEQIVEAELAWPAKETGKREVFVPEVEGKGRITTAFTVSSAF